MSSALAVRLTPEQLVKVLRHMPLRSPHLRSQYSRPPACAGGRLLRSWTSGDQPEPVFLFLSVTSSNSASTTFSPFASFAAAPARAGPRAGTRLRVGLLGLVHRLAELHRGLGQRVGLGLDRLDVLACQRRLQPFERTLDLGLLGGAAPCRRTPSGAWSSSGPAPRPGCGRRSARASSCLPRRAARRPSPSSGCRPR